MQLNKDDAAYTQKLNLINDEHRRKTAQYISEGITFFFVTLLVLYLFIVLYENNFY